MKRFIALFLSWPFLKTRSLTAKAQLHNLLLVLEACAFTADLDNTLHVAALSANEAASYLKLFVIVDLNVEPACVFNIIVVIIVIATVVVVISILLLLQLLLATPTASYYLLLCLYSIISSSHPSQWFLLLLAGLIGRCEGRCIAHHGLSVDVLEAKRWGSCWLLMVNERATKGNLRWLLSTLLLLLHIRIIVQVRLLRLLLLLLHNVLNAT